MGSKAVSKSGLHESTTNKIYQLVGQATGKCQRIEIIVNEHAQQVILENRKNLAPIVDSIKLSGRLGLSLRGHPDDSQCHPDIVHIH